MCEKNLSDLLPSLQEYRRLVLCGLPKSGKTTLGKELSRLLSLPFFDTDSLVEAKHKTSCRTLFNQMGEERFRDLERREVLTLTDLPEGIIALGGGTLLNQDLIPFLRQFGLLIYLEVCPEMLWERFSDLPSYLDPVNPKQSFYRLVHERVPIFESACHAKLRIWPAIQLEHFSKS